MKNTEPLPRVLGTIRGERSGPTLICVAGIHGNEPAGIQALTRVFASLARPLPHLRGELVGLAGNLAALERRQRYLDVDLNRQWRQGRAREDWASPTSEDGERRELADRLQEIFERATGDVYVIDLHTTSGNSAPFVVMGDTLANRAFARHFPIPVALGLEEHLDGTLTEYLTSLGHTSLVIEAGQHDSPAAVDQAEAAVWVGLAAAGLVDAEAVPQVSGARELLGRAASHLPRLMEVRYRHVISSGDGFRMQPGFDNFARIQPGQLLARDRTGELRSRWSGRLLMPFYQRQGNDGFFVVRELRTEWLFISALLRRLRFDAFIHWLPGIARHPSRPDTLVVNQRVARWRSLEILHLLGFRRKRQAGDVLLVSRRERVGRRDLQT